jgi:cation transport ATPase
MHCPRCGTNATIGQQFCRSCGLNLEKVTELLGEEAELSSAIDERARLRERQRKFEQWGSIAGLVTFGLILLLMIVVVFLQMILKGGAIVGLLLILLAIGAAVMGLFQTYSKSLMAKLTNPPRPLDVPGSNATRKLEGHREPVPTVTDRTTELLVPTRTADTGKMDD